MGKSSVAHETLRRMDGVEAVRTFAFDCEDGFARAVIDAVLQHETGLAGVLSRINQIRRGTEPMAVLSDHATEVALRIGRTPPGRVMVTEAMDALAAAPAGVSGTVVLLGLRVLFGQSGEPFYGFAEGEHLAPASPEQWVDDLTRRSTATGVGSAHEEAWELVRRTGSRPCESMRVAHHAVMRALLRQGAAVSRADVAAAYEHTLTEAVAIGRVLSGGWRTKAGCLRPLPARSRSLSHCLASLSDGFPTEPTYGHSGRVIRGIGVPRGRGLQQAKRQRGSVGHPRRLQK